MQVNATSNLQAIYDTASRVLDRRYESHRNNIARLIHCSRLRIERDDEIAKVCTIQRAHDDDDGVVYINLNHNGQTHRYISEVRTHKQTYDYKQTGVWEKVDGIFLGFRTRNHWR